MKRLSRRLSGAFAAAALTVGVLAGLVLVAAPAAAATAYDHTVRTDLVPTGMLSLDSGQVKAFADGVPVASGLPTELGDRWTWQVGSPTLETSLVTRGSGRILDYGRPTEYWVGLSTDQVPENDDDLADGRADLATDVLCFIYLGDPENGGRQLGRETESPYLCEKTGMSFSGNLTTVRVELTVRDWANLEGSLRAEGLDLTDGTLETRTRHVTVGNVPLDNPQGHPTVTDGSRVLWQLAQRNYADDTAPPIPQLRFSYRIEVAGTPTEYWVLGESHNNRVGIGFRSDSSCEIYRGNPTNGGVVDEKNPYRCDVEFDYLYPLAYQYPVFDFTVSRAQVVDLGPLEAKAMLDRLCTDENSPCTYELTRQDIVYGQTLQVNRPIPNNGATPMTQQQSVSHLRSVSNSFGVSVSIKERVFDLFEATMTVNYGLIIRDDDGTAFTQTITIPPGCNGWFELTPTYIAARGDYLVRDGDTWYRAKDVVWTVPDPQSSPGEWVPMASKIDPASSAKCTFDDLGQPVPSVPGPPVPTTPVTTSLGAVTGPGTTTTPLAELTDPAAGTGSTTQVSTTTDASTTTAAVAGRTGSHPNAGGGTNLEKPDGAAHLAATGAGFDVPQVAALGLLVLVAGAAASVAARRVRSRH